MTANESIEAYTKIPLTEEWLIRLGFEKVHNDASKHFYTKKILTVDCVNNCGMIFSVSHFFLTNGGQEKWVSQRLEYVHQLQNLYYAMTGEELEI